MRIRLGVNIDHIATVRNARGEVHPDPYFVAKNIIKYGADSITIHLREDRRHIKDKDLKILSLNKSIPLNLEIASNFEMLNIALKHKPKFVCIVPEKRNEVTTEGGLNLKKNKNWKKSKYSSWIKMYSSKEYQSVAKDNIAYLDYLYKINKKKNIKSLITIFKKASELEANFWQMAYK